jgi:hypothetical protein
VSGGHVKHPDVFSFGEQGRVLIRATYYISYIEEVRSQYDYDVMDAERTCGARRAIAISVFRRRMRSDGKDKVAPVYYPLGTDGKTGQFAISRPPTIEEDNAHRNNIERIEQEHLLDQALFFYKACKSLSFCHNAY